MSKYNVMQMKILITGAYGFIGTKCSRFFKGEGAELVSLDITKKESVLYKEQYLWGEQLPTKGLDTIIHLAGKAHDTSLNPASEPYFAINRDLTVKIFDYFIESEATTFIMFSTAAAVADELPKGFTLTEDNLTPSPSTAYGLSKLQAEQYIMSKKLPEGKLVYILRPTMVYGEGAPGNLSLLINVVKKGIPYPFGNFDNRRTFVSIDNLLFVLKELINKRPASDTFFVADDQSLSTVELIRLIGEAMGRNVKIWNIPRFLVNFMVTLGDTLHTPLNYKRFNKMTGDFIASNKKLLGALGVSKLPFNAEKMMLQTLKTFKK